jgi:hypothetical protein
MAAHKLREVLQIVRAQDVRVTVILQALWVWVEHIYIPAAVAAAVADGMAAVHLICPVAVAVPVMRILVLMQAMAILL